MTYRINIRYSACGAEPTLDAVSSAKRAVRPCPGPTPSVAAAKLDAVARRADTARSPLPRPPCPPSPSTASTATPNSPRSCTRSRASIRTSCAIESIGKSHEGRDIWVLTVTNAATGPAAEKPAFWVDGNIHATEVAASAANLYFLHTLVTQYGKDADVTRALDTRAFYVCPRINPDGAEWALADKPKWIRSSTRPVSVRRGGRSRGSPSRTSTATAASCRCASPTPTALWKAHPERAAAHGPARSRSRPAAPTTGSCPRARSRTTTATRCA